MATKTDSLAFIVEDDEKLVAIFTRALKEAGFKVHIAMNGQQAIRITGEIGTCCSCPGFAPPRCYWRQSTGIYPIK